MRQSCRLVDSLRCSVQSALDNGAAMCYGVVMDTNKTKALPTDALVGSTSTEADNWANGGHQISVLAVD